MPPSLGRPTDPLTDDLSRQLDKVVDGRRSAMVLREMRGRVQAGNNMKQHFGGHPYLVMVDLS